MTDPEQGIAGPATVPVEFLLDMAPALIRGVPGEPVWLTLRSLRGAWELAGSTEVPVCENLTALEAVAGHHSAVSQPSACTFGPPSQATWELLTDPGEVHCQVWTDGDVVG